MTKAAVRSMDAIQDFVSKTTGIQIEKFMVGGASKVFKSLIIALFLVNSS